MYYYKFAVIG